MTELVAVEQRVEVLERQPLGVHREQGEDLGLPPVEQQPLAVEPGLGRAQQVQGQPRPVVGDIPRGAGVAARVGHRGLDQPGHDPSGRQPDRVGAVPGRRQVDHAELLTRRRVVHRRGPAHPVVHDRRVVLGAEHHRRRTDTVGQVECVGADTRVVPAATGHEVDGLGLAAHDAPAVRPQDAGLGVGHRDHEVAVLGRAPEVGLDAGDGGLQRGAVPEGGGLGLVGQWRLGHLARQGRPGALPAVQDLGPDQPLGSVTLLDEGRPRAHGVDTTTLQVGVVCRHQRSPGSAPTATLAEGSTPCDA